MSPRCVMPIVVMLSCSGNVDRRVVCSADDLPADLVAECIFDMVSRDFRNVPLWRELANARGQQPSSQDHQHDNKKDGWRPHHRHQQRLQAQSKHRASGDAAESAAPARSHAVGEGALPARRQQHKERPGMSVGSKRRGAAGQQAQRRSVARHDDATQRVRSACCVRS